MTRETQSFEEMMQELERIVQELDNETVSLEESLDLHRRGMKLPTACDTILKDTEKKMNDLIKEEAKSVKNDELIDE